MSRPERPKLRNYTGMAIMLAGLTVYVFLAAAAIEKASDWPLALQILLYVIAGILWIWPARRLLHWMAKPSVIPTDNRTP